MHTSGDWKVSTFIPHGCKMPVTKTIPGSNETQLRLTIFCQSFCQTNYFHSLTNPWVTHLTNRLRE